MKVRFQGFKVLVLMPRLHSCYRMLQSKGEYIILLRLGTVEFPKHSRGITLQGSDSTQPCLRTPVFASLKLLTPQLQQLAAFQIPGSTFNLVQGFFRGLRIYIYMHIWM